MPQTLGMSDDMRKPIPVWDFLFSLAALMSWAYLAWLCPFTILPIMFAYWLGARHMSQWIARGKPKG